MNKKLIAAAALMCVLCCGCGNSIGSDSGTTTVTAEQGSTQKGENTEPAPEETTTEETTTTTTVETTTLVSTSLGLEEETCEIINGCLVSDIGTPLVRAMEQFYYSDDVGEYFAETVDSFATAVGTDVNTWLMCIPSSQALYTPEDVRGDYSDQAESAKDQYDKLKVAKGVYVNDALEAHKAEYLYSRTDYHWQPLAAFYSAQVFAEQLGLDFADYTTYEKIDREGYLGAFYSVTDIDALAEYPDTFTYYKPANLDNCTFTYHDTYFNEGYEGSLFFEDLDIGSSYTIFVGSDSLILEVDTDVDNGRTLVIFKDSYGNALLPFLTSSFEKIYLCDPRFFDINSVDFCKQVGATDVLFAQGASSSTTYSKIELIEQSMNK